jgi:hypothetical protein
MKYLFKCKECNKVYEAAYPPFSPPKSFLCIPCGTVCVMVFSKPMVRYNASGFTSQKAGVN